MALIVLTTVALLGVTMILVLVLRSFNENGFFSRGTVLVTAGLGAVAIVLWQTFTRKR